MTTGFAGKIRAAEWGGLCFVLLLVGAVAAPAQIREPASATVRRGAIHYGPFVAGGFGTGERSDFGFLNAGGQVGFVVTPEYLPGILCGNFEVGAEAIPFWQSYTPHKTYRALTPGGVRTFTSGGTYTGVALTPLILRWNFTHGTSLRNAKAARVVPWAQGAGGLLYTTHKYPLPGTSVWNFEPQFGVGAHVFLNERHSVDFGANAIHISNASLADRNPGVNALVQFQVGYTWWKK